MLLLLRIVRLLTHTAWIWWKVVWRGHANLRSATRGYS